MSNQQRSRRSGRSAKAALPNPNQSRRRKTKRVRRVRQRRATGIQLSDCAKRYAMAIMNPFQEHLSDDLPCIPDLQELPSYKLSLRTRGTFFIGTQKNGCLLVNPFTNVGDLPLGLCSSSVYADPNTYIPPVATAGLAQIIEPNFPFTSAATRAMRTVACGIRVRYIGTEMNRGGLVVMASSAAVNDDLVQQNIALRQNAEVFPCDRKWHTMSYRPMWAAATDYYGAGIRSCGTDTDVCMGIIVTGTAGEQYEFEIIRYLEFIPFDKNQVPSITPSHSDVVGMSAVRNYLGTVANSAAGQAIYDGFLGWMQNNGASMIKSAITTAFPSSQLLLANY